MCIIIFLHASDTHYSEVKDKEIMSKNNDRHLREVLLEKTAEVQKLKFENEK